MLRTLFLAAAASLALGACTTAGETAAAMPTDRDCFYANSVTGFNVVDDHHVRVRAGANRDYILTTAFNTRELDWTETIALRSRTDWVCTGSVPDVEIIGGRTVRRYVVTAVERAPETPAGS